MTLIVMRIMITKLIPPITEARNGNNNGYKMFMILMLSIS